MKLTEKQRYIVYRVKQNIESGIMEQKIGGYAGVGKTTIVRYLVKFFPDFAVCAFTGKAASVLRKKGLNASTIHSLIYTPVIENGVLVDFELATRDMLNCSGIIIDEGSTVSKDIYLDLKSYELPLIFIGDHGQLEPVGTDFNIMSDPDYKLEEIHRNAGEIAIFANHLRCGYPARRFKTSGDSVAFLDKNYVTDEDLLDVDQIICAYNKTRVSINKRVRNALNFGESLQVGDKVICLKNNKNLGLFNGMQGKVKRLYKGGNKNLMDFEFDDQVYQGVWYDKRYFNCEKPEFDYVGQENPSPFDYAYAITCHKCVHPSTIVETPNGLMPIGLINKTSGTIATPQGEEKYKNYVSNRRSFSVRMRTFNGHNLIASHDHKIEIWNGEEYVMTEASNARRNQFVRLKLGHTIDVKNKKTVPRELYDGHLIIDKSVAELIGYLMGDCSINGREIAIFSPYGEVLRNSIAVCRNWLDINPNFGLTSGRPYISFSNRNFSNFAHTFLSAESIVPDIIAQSPLSIQMAFLKGLFNNAQLIINEEKVPTLVCDFNRYPDDLLRVMFLRIGIPINCSSDSTRALIVGSDCKTFRDKIGFSFSYNNDLLEDCDLDFTKEIIPLSKEEAEYLKKYLNKTDIKSYNGDTFVSKKKANEVLKQENDIPFLKEKMGYFHDKISNLENLMCETVCVETPSHKFMQNGFPFGNSQGDEFSKVLVFEQYNSNWDHKRWTYTAASRAKEKLFWAN